MTNHTMETGIITRRSPLPVQSLWSWNHRNEELSRSIVYGLKGCAEAKRWLPFATLLLQIAGPLSRESSLIPIPSKSGKSDHAMGLTMALRVLTGFPIEEVLSFHAKEGHQRERNRLQRSRVELVKTKRLKRGGRHLILVDDVVTSGGTLRAAFRALNEPIAAHAFCFMDRALLRI